MSDIREPNGARPSWEIRAGWLLLLAGLILAFAHNFQEMWIRWFPAWQNHSLSLYRRVIEGESYYTHGPLVPLVSFIICLLLVRHTRIQVRPRPVLGLTFLGLSLLLHLASTTARVNFLSGFAMIGVLGSLVLTFWGGRALLRLWFPLALLLFMVPLPEVSIAQMNFRLKMLSADWGVRLANVVGVMAERSGNRVFLEGDKSLVVANVCNGLRTLISVLAFGSVYAYVCRLQGPWRLFLFLMSVPVAVVSNAIRITSLIVVADIYNVQVATGWYHDFSGVLIFLLAYLMMFGLERVILFGRHLLGRPAPTQALFANVRRTPEDASQWSDMLRSIGRRWSWTAVAMVLLMGAAAWQLSRVVPPTWNQQMARKAVPAELTVGSRKLVGYEMTMDERTLTILETHDYVYRRYVVAGPPQVPHIDLCIIFSQDNRKGTHPPDLCLEGGGNGIVAQADVGIPTGPGQPDVPGRELVVQSANDRQYFLYTYKCGSRYTDSFWMQQWTIFLNGLTAGNASGALVRVSTPMPQDTPVSQARQRCVAMLQAALPSLDQNLP